MPIKILTLPGLTNSGSKHWQTLWEKMFPDTIKRVNQTDWETPACEDWVEVLEKAIQENGEDIILVAHSLACILVSKWAEKYPRKIRGAVLVAPSDVDADTYPREATGFSPMPSHKLPFPSVVVASTNDPYITVERAQFFSKKWGADFVTVGAKGHINSDSNLGIWLEGLKILSQVANDNRYVKINEFEATGTNYSKLFQKKIKPELDQLENQALINENEKPCKGGEYWF